MGTPLLQVGGQVKVAWLCWFDGYGSFYQAVFLSQKYGILGPIESPVNLNISIPHLLAWRPSFIHHQRPCVVAYQCIK